MNGFRKPNRRGEERTKMKIGDRRPGNSEIGNGGLDVARGGGDRSRLLRPGVAYPHTASIPKEVNNR